MLATYSEDKPEGKRIYPCVFPCTANLFGEPLSVRSLPYQEQDNVLAKCATVAPMVKLQESRTLVRYSCPAANVNNRICESSCGQREAISFRGLIVEQMCSAILGVGLEPEVVRYPKDVPLISLLYGYLKAGPSRHPRNQGSRIVESMRLLLLGSRSEILQSTRERPPRAITDSHDRPPH